jgi:hypothetical protein
MFDANLVQNDFIYGYGGSMKQSEIFETYSCNICIYIVIATYATSR